MVERQGRLSTFDRFGVAVVAFLGAVVGLFAGLTSHLPVFSILIFPGLLFEFLVGLIRGKGSGVIACGVANGAIYGFGFYWFCRFADYSRRR